MTTKELSQILSNIDSIKDKYPIAVKLIAELNFFFMEVGSVLDNVLKFEQKEVQTDKINSLRSEFNKPIQYLREQSVGIIFVELSGLIADLSSLSNYFPIVRDLEHEEEILASWNLFTSVISSLEYFYKKFEQSVGHFGSYNTFQLMKYANDIYSRFDTIGLFSESLKQMLSKEQPTNNGEEQLSIYFDSNIEYDNMIAKLTAIRELYFELCRLLQISTSEFPLKLAKLEIGSWWIKIFGESKVITLMTSLVDSGVSFIHRNFTKEGKIEAIPKAADKLERLLELSKKLEERGIDTKELNENIKHSSVVISNQLNTLLIGEPNVEINEKRYYIGEEMDAKFLKESRSLFLEAGTPDVNTDEAI